MKAGVTALAALLALAGAAVAWSAGPGKGAFFGGGQIEATYTAGFHPKLAWINLAVSKDGKTVTAYGDWNAACTGYSAPARASFVAKAIAPKPDGSFTATGELSGANTTGHYVLAGRFTSPTSAVGTGQAQFTFLSRGPQTSRKYECDTGTVNWQARDDAHSPSGGKPSPKANAVYYGNVRGSTGRLPFMLRVGSTGKTVEEATALVDARCTQDPSYYAHADPIFAHVKIKPGGTFTGRTAYTDSLLGKGFGQEGRVTMSIGGRFGGSTVTGTWRVAVKIVFSSTGKLVDSCSSGAMTFKAAR